MAPGRKLRCAQCAHEWVPPASAPEAPAEAAISLPARIAPAAPPPAPAPPVVPQLPAPVIALPPPRPVMPLLAPRLEPVRDTPHPSDPHPATAQAPGRRAQTAPRMDTPLALAGSLIVVMGAVAAMVVWRTEVMLAWPPSERLFHWLGLL